MYPIFVVLLDGLADRAHDSLGGRTANEIAETPNLDRLAAQGSCGLMFSLGPGRAPASELAHWAMLGYTPEEFPGRAVLEATGAEQEIDPGHVFAFAALRPAERRDDGLWLTGRPRRGEDEEDSAELVTACDGLEIDGLRFELEHLQRGEAILRVFPGADDRVTDSDAFFKEWYPVLKPQAQVPEAGEHGTRRRDVDAADDRAARGTSRQRAPRLRRAPAAERDHAQVVGHGGGRTRASASATACTAASSATRRSCSASRGRSASSRATSPRPVTRRPTCAPAWSWRSQRLD